MKKIFLFFASLGIGIFLLQWVMGRIGWEETKQVFFDFSGWGGLAILGLSFLMLLVGNWRWMEILKKQKINLPFFPLFRFYLAGFCIMFLAPIMIFGGETFRAYLLKRKYSVSWDKGMASVIVERMIELTVYVLIILSGVVFLFFSAGTDFGDLKFILGSILAFSAAGIGLFYFKCFKKQSILKFFGGFFSSKLNGSEPFEVEKEIFKLLKPKEKFFWRIVGLSFLKCGVTLLRAWVLLLFLGKILSFLPALSVLSFSYLALMVPIPAALGTHETFQAFSFSSLGMETSAAPVFTMIIRGSELFISLIGMILVMHFGMDLAKDVLFKKIEKLANWKNGKADF
jgi:glycosyltransferase 2 family protein